MNPYQIQSEDLTQSDLGRVVSFGRPGEPRTVGTIAIINDSGVFVDFGGEFPKRCLALYLAWEKTPDA